MPFKKPSYYKEKKVVEKIIKKCSFCKTRDSVGNLGEIYYCANNACAAKFWEK